MALKRTVLGVGLAVALTLSPMLPAHQPRTDYAANLAALNGEYQWVLALRETCNRIQPKRQPEIDGALGLWRARHKALIDDLEARVAAMVKAASKDQKEYTRNYARSQSEVLKQREEESKQLLALPSDELQKLCSEFPGYLRDARSDIPTRLPEEFAAQSHLDVLLHRL